MKAGKAFAHRRNKSDYFQTPYSITEQLLEREKFTGQIFESACGDGAILEILKKHGYMNTVAIDIKDNDSFDFLKYNNVTFNSIITNPPFSLATEFVIKAKELYTKKIAFLLPLNYLHGQKRYKLKIFKELATVYVFTRYPLLTDKIRPDGKYKTGCIVYAWYVWKKRHKKEPVIKWIDNNKYVLSKSDK